MRLLVLSDLHHELWRGRAPIINPLDSRPDVVILAGDINTGAKAVEWASEVFAGLPVLYVQGNHEAYGANLDDVQDHIDAACAASENVIFLNCREVRLDGVRFLGAIMWTDFCLFGDDQRRSCFMEAEAGMNDYKRIRLAKKGYRKLRAGDTVQFHAIQRAWLAQKLADPFDGKTVVATHMAPSILSVPERFATDPLSAAYASDLEDLVMQADLWVHGHVHDSCDYHVGRCRVVCNPCGYPTPSRTAENVQFDPNFIVQL
jgi:predicted phosphodiesterase